MNLLLKYKKIFLGIGLIIVAIAIGYLIYFIFFFSEEDKINKIENEMKDNSQGIGFPESEGNRQITEITTSTETGIPDSENKPGTNTISNPPVDKTVALNNNASLEITLDKNGKDVKYYNQDDGKFYKIDKNGEVVTLSEQVFYNVEKVTWQPKKEKAIIEYPDGSNIIYDFGKEEQKTIPKHWEDFNFSPSGGNIVLESIGMDPNNKWLVITDNDGKNPKIIEKLGNNADTVYPEWSPNNKIIGMYTKGVDLNRQEVYFIGENNENFKSMIVEGRDFRPKWSDNGEKLLYSVYSTDNNQKPKIWIADASPESIGNERKSLGIETWVDKCTFANDQEIYCGVPKELKDGAGMFSELAENTIDDLYKINIQTKEKEKIKAFNGNYNISEIIVSEDGKYIYFTDKLTQKIHKISL